MGPRMPRPPLRILVVEDEEAHAELICRAFEDGNSGSSVVVVPTCGEALDSLDTSFPDLIIADLLLPDGKGTELLGDARIADRVPLIVMTSHGNEEAAVEALKQGGN